MALFAAALAIWFSVLAVDVLILVLVAALLAVYLSAITDQLEHRFGIARWIGITVAAVGTLAIVTALGTLLVAPVVAQTRALVSGLPQTLAGLQAALTGLAQRYPVLQDSELADPQSGLVAGLVTDASGFLRGAMVPYLRAGGKLFVDGAAVLVMALYFARRPALYRDGIVALVAPAHRGIALQILADLGATLRAWVTGQLLSMVLLSAFTAIGLWLLQVPYWLAFGLFTGLVALVPFFGTLVSTILPAVFIIGTGSTMQVIAVLALGTVVHVVGMNVVVPLIMERTVAIPPALTIAGVLIMGTLLGPIGLVVAVPIIAIVMVVVRHVLQGEIYGAGLNAEPAVLRTTGRHHPPT